MSAAGAVVWRDSIIFIFGGNSPTLGKALRYNIITNTFTTLPGMPSPVTDALVVMWRDSVVYVVAGGDGLFGTTVSNVVRRYSINTNTWITVISLPETKSMIGGGIYRDTIYVKGGWTGSTSSEMLVNHNVIILKNNYGKKQVKRIARMFKRSVVGELE